MRKCIRSQKTKEKWIKEGDGNAKFFHRIANGRKRKNLITKLIIGGEEESNFEKISNELKSFYENLYTLEKISRPRIDNFFDACLTPEKACLLEAQFFEEEIKEAIFSMNKDKSPSLDSFSMFFHQKYWDFIKEDLMKVFQEFHEGHSTQRSSLQFCCSYS